MIKGILGKLLPPAAVLTIKDIHTRVGASTGVWLLSLLPFACSPGLYTAYSHCHPQPQILAILGIQVGVCGIHLYQQLCLKCTDDDISKRKPPLFQRLLSHPYTPALAATGALSLLTETNPGLALLICLLCSRLLYSITHTLFTHFPRSFSLGEGALVGQAAALTLTTATHNIIHKLFVYDGKLSEDMQISIFVQVAVLLVSALSFLTFRFSFMCKARNFVPAVFVCGALGAGLASLLIKEWILNWLILLCDTPTRLTLLSFWIGLSIFSILITTWAARAPGIRTTVLRKAYHVVIVAIFAPGILQDPAFTQLAASGAMLFWVLCEVVRVQDIKPFSGIITTAFKTFLDEKDQGKLILSHIYLLAGVATPLWLYPCSQGSQGLTLQNPGSRDIALLAGVLSVGIGDAAASIGGTYFGRKKWAGTAKTMEGSLCSVFAMLGCVGVLSLLEIVTVSGALWGRLVISSVLVSVVEALTDQVDNIVLPLLLYTPLMDP